MKYLIVKGIFWALYFSPTTYNQGIYFFPTIYNQGINLYFFHTIYNQGINLYFSPTIYNQGINCSSFLLSTTKVLTWDEILKA